MGQAWISLGVSKKMKDDIKRTAEREGMTVSEYCRQAIGRALDEDMTHEEVKEMWEGAEGVEITSLPLVHSPYCTDPQVIQHCSDGCSASCKTCGWGRSQQPCPSQKPVIYNTLRFTINRD